MPQLVQKALPATNAAVSSVLAEGALAVLEEAANSTPRVAALDNTISSPGTGRPRTSR